MKGEQEEQELRYLKLHRNWRHYTHQNLRLEKIRSVEIFIQCTSTKTAIYTIHAYIEKFENLVAEYRRMDGRFNIDDEIDRF